MGLPLIYTGPLDRKKMDVKARYAYEAFCGLKARSKKSRLPAPTFTAREFIAWWLRELETFSGTTATCGRKDHSRGYSWENIEMQDMADNSREMNLRTGVRDREKAARGEPVFSFNRETGEVLHQFQSIREAAKFYGVSQRLAQFIVRGKYAGSRKLGVSFSRGVSHAA